MIKSLFLCIVLMGVMLFESKAQVHIPVSVPITISEVLNLEVSPTTTMTFNFTTSKQIDDGVTQPSPQTLTYKSNKAFYITITGVGLTGNFTGGIAGAPMPISMLKYKLSTSSVWLPLSDSPQFLMGTPAAMISRGTKTIMVDFRMDPGYVTHPADDYMVTVSYNIANQ